MKMKPPRLNAIVLCERAYCFQPLILYQSKKPIQAVSAFVFNHLVKHDREISVGELSLLMIFSAFYDIETSVYAFKQ